MSRLSKKLGIAVLSGTLPLTACVDIPVPPLASQALPAEASASTRTYAAVKDQLDGAIPPESVMPTSATPPTYQITGLGYSQISGQMGKTINEKRLMAIRAARLEAMRDLVEQIHGLRLTSTTTVKDAIVRDDQLQATVSGIIRGARTVRLTPKDSDTFEVVLALDPTTIAYIVKASKNAI
jgi:hypothetical protein